MRASIFKQGLLTISMVLLVFVGQVKAQENCKIPFWREGAHIYVSVDVDSNEDQTFLFDTGAGENIISLNFAKRLGLKLGRKSNVKSFGGIQTAYSIVMPSLTIGGVSFQNVEFLAIPKINSGNQNYSGVIGCSFIKEKVLKIDNESEYLILNDKDYPYEGKGIKLPLVESGGLIGMEISLNTATNNIVKGNFIIDTGADASLIFMPHSENKYKLCDGFKESIENVTKSPGGDFVTVVSRLPSINFGSMSLNDVPIKVISPGDQMPRFNPFYLGFIGNKILEKFNIILNISEKYMVLEPLQNVDEKIIIDPLGFKMFRNKQKQFVIGHIVKGGAADKAGLKVNDVITKIDGNPSSEYVVPEFLSIVSRIGNTLDFTIYRNGETFDVKYTPVDCL